MAQKHSKQRSRALLASPQAALLSAIAALAFAGTASAQNPPERHPAGEHPAGHPAPAAHPAARSAAPAERSAAPAERPGVRPAERPGAPAERPGFRPNERPGASAERPGFRPNERPGAPGFHPGNPGARPAWNNGWRNDSRYNWRGYRDANRGIFHLRRYDAPRPGWAYRRLSAGFILDPLFFGQSYWITNPWVYRLPPVYPPYQWVRYYNDALLIDTSTGQVVDANYDFFW